MHPTERRSRILALLAAQGSVQVEGLSQQLGVSRMTIHRDLDQLAAEGRVRKVHGGAVIADALPTSTDECPICHKRAPTRIQMVLHLANECHRRACCPHCGLLALATLGSQVVSALVPDFLYGYMVSAQAASYVLRPEIHLCCEPTVLAFRQAEDALRFQRGFGGQVLGLAEAIRALQQEVELAHGSDIPR